MIDVNELTSLDQYALTKLNWIINRVNKAYRDFDFHVVFHTLYNYCSVDLSSLYLDILKDRLYCEKRDGLKRRSAQTTLHIILSSIVKLMAPILVFTAEEVWQEFNSGTSGTLSIHLTGFPQPVDSAALSNLDVALWENMISLRQDVSKSLEEARASKIIGSSLDSRVEIRANADLIGSIRKLEDPEGFFIVSQLALAEVSNDAPQEILVSRAEGQKCPRCWIWSKDIGLNQRYPEVCPRCASVLEQTIGQV